MVAMQEVFSQVREARPDESGRMEEPGVDVSRAGAVGDGKTLNTACLQGLIDECRERGGGALVFPAGVYLTGGLVLCSHLTMRFEAGAVLLGSPDLGDYAHHNPSPEPFPEGYEGVRALLSAVDCEAITLEGSGTVDGQGALFEQYPQVRGGRPRNLWFARCRGVTVQELRLRNSGFWMQHYLNCTDVRLSDLEIWNHGGTNNDGIDIDGCRDVIIERCQVDSSDDAICLKSGNASPTENVVVRDCRTSTHCNHFKTGTESRGGFHNIRVSGLIMTPSAVRDSHAATEGADWRGACGIALGAVDGGSLTDIKVSGVTMDRVRVPFFIRLGDRGQCPPGVPQAGERAVARGITISGVEARNAGRLGAHIIGLPESPVCDVIIEDCVFHYEDWDVVEGLVCAIPESGAAYPSCDAFGMLPAYGVSLRDARNIRFSEVEFHPSVVDPRPGLHWESATGIELHKVKGRHHCDQSPEPPAPHPSGTFAGTTRNAGPLVDASSLA